MVGDDPAEADQAWIPDRIPVDVAERLHRAMGHRNATDRYLWNDIGRGLWSAMQARARLAEVWLLLVGRGDDLPAVTNKQSSEDCEQRFAEFVAADPPQHVLEAWTTVVELESKLRPWGERFPRGRLDEAAFRGGYDCAEDYERALDALLNQFEGLVADHCLPDWMRPGCWVEMSDGRQGELLAVSGLRAHLYVPGVDPEQSQWQTIIDLRYGSLRGPVEPPPWPERCRLTFSLQRSAAGLAQAAAMWDANRERPAISGNKAAPANGFQCLSKALASLDMAWRSARATYSVMALSAPDPHDLQWAVRAGDDELQARAEAVLSMMAQWRHEHYAAVVPEERGWQELASIHEQLRQLHLASERLLAAKLAVPTGDWFVFDDGGQARLAARLGLLAVLVDDNGRVRCRPLFALERAAEPEAGEPEPRWSARAEVIFRRAAHAHWLGERLPCNCCGLPGQTPHRPHCVICGWHEPVNGLSRHWRNHWLPMDRVRARLLYFAEASGAFGDPCWNGIEQRQLRRSLMWRLVSWLDAGAPAAESGPVLELWQRYLKRIDLEHEHD